jgi:hypothetical protein
MQEIWKGVIYQNIDYSEFYEVSNSGKLRNAKTKREIKMSISKTEYFVYYGSLGSRKKRKNFRLHRCIAEAFIPKIEGKEHINHIDGNKLNNVIENLEWCTNQENVQHAWDNELFNRDSVSGTNSRFSKLSQEDIDFIKRNYIPYDKDFGTRGLAKKFNVNHSIISELLNKKTYRLN